MINAHTYHSQMMMISIVSRASGLLKLTARKILMFFLLIDAETDCQKNIDVFFLLIDKWVIQLKNAARKALIVLFMSKSNSTNTALATENKLYRLMISRR